MSASAAQMRIIRTEAVHIRDHISGSKDKIVSPKIAKSVVLKGIGKRIKNDPKYLQISFRKHEGAALVRFLIQWTEPRTVVHLAAGKLILVNVM